MVWKATPKTLYYRIIDLKSHWIAEYGIGGKASMQEDVYSYGIPLLEMVKGKRPTDEMFKDGFNIHHFANMGLPERLVQIVD